MMCLRDQSIFLRKSVYEQIRKVGKYTSQDRRILVEDAGNAGDDQILGRNLAERVEEGR